LATPRGDDAAGAALALLLPAPPAPLPRGAVPAARRVRCQVPDCTALEGLAVRRFTARARVCDAHAAASAVQLATLGLSRLCVRCATFHTLDAFEGARRFCLASQDRRNERRRDAYARHRSAGARRAAAAAAAAAAAPAAAAPAAPSSSTLSDSAIDTLLGGVDADADGGDDADAELRRDRALTAAAERFLLSCNAEDVQLAQDLGLTDDAGGDTAAALPPPPPSYARGLPPWQAQHAPPWAPQHVSLKFPAASPLMLPRGFAEALQYALYGTSQPHCGATLAVLAQARLVMEGGVAPGCTLLRCDMALLCAADEEGTEAAPAGAVDAVARLLAAAAVAHPEVSAFLAAQAPWSLGWRGAVALVDAAGGVRSGARAPDAPPPLQRLPPPRTLAAAVGQPLTLPLASLAVAHARPQCRFHGRVLAGVRHAAPPPRGAPAALYIAALPPTPGCALLEYAPREGDDAGPFPAPRPLVVCPSAAVADEINTLSPRRSDASEALLWALGTAPRRDVRCPLPLAALVTAVAISRGWAATTDALLAPLRESFDDVADADGHEHALDVLEATLGRRDTLARRAERTCSARILAAVLAAGGPEAAFGTTASASADGDDGALSDDDSSAEERDLDDEFAHDDDDDDVFEDALYTQAHASAGAAPPALPSELVRQAFRCYAFCFVFIIISVRFVRATVASLALTPEMVAAAMPNLPPHYAACIYHSRTELSYRFSLLLCLAGMLLTRVRRLAPLYARLHVPLMSTLLIWQMLLVPVLGAMLASREWGFGTDLVAGQIGVPYWNCLRVHGWMVSFSAFGAAAPLPPRLMAPLLLLRGLLPLAPHVPGGENLGVRANLVWCCVHALVMAALALTKWQMAARQAAAAAAAAQATAARKRL
jgi:hypothetical protein